MGGSYPRSKVDLGHGRGWLTAESAASIFRIDREIGHPLQITEAGRDWAEQNEHYQHYLKYGYPIALNPNTPSVHQIGDAIDSDELQLDPALATRHGWIRTVYRWVNGVWTLVERWHYEHFIERDSHRNDPAPAPEPPTVEPKEHDMFDTIYAVQSDGQAPDKSRVFEIFRDPRTGEVVKNHIVDTGVWGAIEAAHKRRGIPASGSLAVPMTARALDKIPTWKK